MAPGVRRPIGDLPPTLQGVALDLKIGEETAITTDEHFSAGHGEHFDIYGMKRVSESEVYMLKWHSGEETGNPTIDEHRAGMASGAVYRPLSGAEKKSFSTGSC